MAYTKVLKPTTTTYTPINAVGKQQYDQASLAYDDATTFYDGTNYSFWTDIAKPVAPNTYAGIASGMLMPLTYKTGSMGTRWTSIAKPI